MTKNALATTAVRFATVSDMRIEAIRLASTGKQLQADMHELNLSIIHHLAQHGQIGVVNHWLAQFEKVESVRKNAMVQWFNTFGACKYNEELGRFEHVKGKKLELAKAKAKPFWKFGALENDKPIKLMTLEAGIKSLIKQMKDNRDKLGVPFTPEEQAQMSALTMMQSGIIPAKYAHTEH